jgi:hypothetical protein
MSVEGESVRYPDYRLKKSDSIRIAFFILFIAYDLDTLPNAAAFLFNGSPILLPTLILLVKYPAAVGVSEEF